VPFWSCFSTKFGLILELDNFILMRVSRRTSAVSRGYLADLGGRGESWDSWGIRTEIRGVISGRPVGVGGRTDGWREGLGRAIVIFNWWAPNWSVSNRGLVWVETLVQLSSNWRSLSSVSSPAVSLTTRVYSAGGRSCLVKSGWPKLSP